MGFAEKLERRKNEIKVRVLIKRLYDAKDKLDEGFAEIDAVNREIRVLNNARRQKQMVDPCAELKDGYPENLRGTEE